MSDAPSFDFAIVGAGVSGLVLAWLLMNHNGSGPLATKSILLIDGANDEDALRTLSFWSRDPGPLEPLVRHRYTTLRIYDRAGGHDVELREHVYRTLFFADLQNETKARLASASRHRVVLGRLSELSERADGCELVVEDQRFFARYVFDSRLRRAELAVDLRRHHLLWQHIHGWVVQSERALFEPGVATLIDFRIGEGHCPPGTAFAYLLPWSRDEALVELVSLTHVDPEPMLRQYLSRHHAVDRFRIRRREAGTSPMTEQPFARQSTARVRRIGIAAGRLKPSTGYALSRIIEDSQAIVRSLHEHGHPFATPGDSRLYLHLDAVLLELWGSHPERIPAIFAALFSRQPPDRVLRFLDEKASLLDLFLLVAALPALPFLRALAACFGRRLGLLPPAAEVPKQLPP